VLFHVINITQVVTRVLRWYEVQCYFSHGFSVKVSVTVMHYKICKLQLSYSYSYHISVSVN